MSCAKLSTLCKDPADKQAVEKETSKEVASSGIDAADGIPGSSSIVSADDYFAELCSGLPLEVKETGKAGRGVYATRTLAAGSTLLITVPSVAHPTLDAIGKVCHLCLRPLSSVSQEGTPVAKKPRQSGTGDHPGLPSGGIAASQPLLAKAAFCSDDCESVAREDFFDLEEAASEFPRLRGLCTRLGKFKFPLVTARLACMVASGCAAPRALEALCYVDVAGSTGGAMPESWVEQHTILLEELGAAVKDKTKLNFLTLEWYMGVMGRLHLNAFRVELVGGVEGPGRGDLLEMAAASVLQDGAVGSAVYLLPSMFNHNCEPNVNVLWDEDAAMALTTLRDITKGEELFITYLDASLGPAARQTQLREAYGFECGCARCMEGD